MKSEERENDIENHGKKIIALALALVLLIGGTYAWLSVTLNGNKKVKLEAGTLSLRIAKESDAINIEDAFPMTEQQGLETTAYEFTLENNGTIASEYSVYLDKDAISGYNEMKEYRIKYSLTKTEKVKRGDNIDQQNDETVDTNYSPKIAILNPLKTDAVAPDTPETGTNPNRLLDSGRLEANHYFVYTLRLWVDESATSQEMENAAFAGHLRIAASQEGIEDE